MKTFDMRKKREHAFKLLMGIMFALAVLVLGNAQTKAYAATIAAPGGTVSNLKQTAATASSVDIQFSAILDTNVQYEVRVSSESNSGYAAMATISGNFTTISGLSAGNTYYVKVVPFYVDDSGSAPVNVYGTESEVLGVVTAPDTAPAAVGQTGSGTNYITVTWSGVDGATGYYVDYCLSDSTTSEKVRMTTETTSANLYGVISSKKYTVYVTPYRASATGFVACDSLLVASKSNLSISSNHNSAPQGKVAGFVQTAATTNSVQIAFQTLSDAALFYSVQISKASNGGFWECGVVTEGKYTFTELEVGATYYVSVTPFYQNWNSLNEQYDRIYGSASDVFVIATTGGPKGTITSLNKKNATLNSIQITFAPFKDDNAYYSVQLKKSANGRFQEVGVVTDGEYTFTELAPATSYYVRVVPFYENKSTGAEQDGRLYGMASSTLQVTTQGAPEGTVNGLSQISATADSAQISFKLLKDKNVLYSVQISQNAKTGYKECDTVSLGEYTFTELKPAATYYVKVVPYYENKNATDAQNNRLYGTASAAFEIVTAPNTTPKEIRQTKATKTGFTVQWDKVSGASGYYVDYYCAGGKEQTTKAVSKNSIQLKKLEAGKEYHLFVTPYKKSDSGFIACDKKNYACKYNIPVLPQKANKPTVKKYWNSLGKVILGTSKLASADGYQYQMYTAYKEKNTKIKTVSSTSYSSTTIESEKLKNASVFKVRVRAYITVEGERIYGNWSDWTYVSPSPRVTLNQTQNAIHASWSKVKGAGRYTVYISTNKYSGYKKCAVTDKNTFLIKKCGKSGIKSNTRYYVYVIPQMEVKDTYVSTSKKDAISEIRIK